MDYPNIKTVYDQILDQKDHSLPALSDDLKKNILWLHPYDKKFYNFTNNLDKNLVDQKQFVWDFERNIVQNKGSSKDYFEQNSYETQLHLGYLLYTIEDYKNLQSLMILYLGDNSDCISHNLHQKERLLQVAKTHIPTIMSVIGNFYPELSLDHLRFDSPLYDKQFFDSIHSEVSSYDRSVDVFKSLQTIFEFGVWGLPLLLGYDKKLYLEMFDTQLLTIKDISEDGHWESSSNKPANNIMNVINNSMDDFWQSNGYLPHTIDVKFPKLTRINNIMMYFSNSQNSSYAPYHIKIYGGTNELDLVLLKDIGIKSVEGFINIFFFDSNIKNKVVTEDDQRFIHIHGLLKNGYVYNPPIEVKFLKISIFSNRHRGKDSKLESVKIYQDLQTNEAIDAKAGKPKVSSESKQQPRNWKEIMKSLKNKKKASQDVEIEKPKEHNPSKLMLGNALII